jgi:hypothetical protein
MFVQSIVDPGGDDADVYTSVPAAKIGRHFCYCLFGDVPSDNMSE